MGRTRHLISLYCNLYSRLQVTSTITFKAQENNNQRSLAVNVRMERFISMFQGLLE